MKISPFKVYRAFLEDGEGTLSFVSEFGFESKFIKDKVLKEIAAKEKEIKENLIKSRKEKILLKQQGIEKHLT